MVQVVRFDSVQFRSKAIEIHHLTATQSTLHYTTRHYSKRNPNLHLNLNLNHRRQNDKTILTRHIQPTHPPTHLPTYPLRSDIQYIQNRTNRTEQTRPEQNRAKSETDQPTARKIPPTKTPPTNPLYPFQPTLLPSPSLPPLRNAPRALTTLKPPRHPTRLFLHPPPNLHNPPRNLPHHPPPPAAETRPVHAGPLQRVGRLGRRISLRTRRRLRSGCAKKGQREKRARDRKRAKRRWKRGG